MLREFRASRFKCFRDLEIGPFKRVNLITGVNNVGKTALLEAIFLHIGYFNQSLPTTINAMRGIISYKMEPANLWGWFFTDRDFDEGIELVGLREGPYTTKLKISLAPRSRTSGKLSDTDRQRARTVGASTAMSMGDHVLIYDYKDSRPHGERFRSEVSIDQQGNVSFALPKRRDNMAYFVSSHAVNTEEEAVLFDELSLKKKQPELLDRARLFEPKLQGLSTSSAYGQRMLVADLGFSELIPLSFAGEGLSKFISILIRMMSVPGGVVLIDEVENGIYCASMKRVWSAIAEVTREMDVQIVASTHSWECIEAAHQAFSEALTYDLGLFRLEKSNGAIRAVAYDQQTLGLAIETGKEVR